MPKEIANNHNNVRFTFEPSGPGEQMMFVFSDMVPVLASTDGKPRRRHRRGSRKKFYADQPQLFSLDDPGAFAVETPNDGVLSAPVSELPGVIAPVPVPDVIVPTLGEPSPSVADLPTAVTTTVAEASVATQEETTLDEATMKKLQKYVNGILSYKPAHSDLMDLYQLAYIAYWKNERAFRKHHDPVNWAIGWNHAKFKHSVMKTIRRDVCDEMQSGSTMLSTSTYFQKWSPKVRAAKAAGLSDEQIAKKYHLTLASVREIRAASEGELAYTETFDDDFNNDGVSSAATNAVRCAVVDSDEIRRNNKESSGNVASAIYAAIDRLSEEDQDVARAMLEYLSSGSLGRSEMAETLAERFDCPLPVMKKRIASVCANLRDELPASIANAVRF